MSAATMLAMLLVRRWSKYGGDIFSPMSNLENIKVEGNVNFLALAQCVEEDLRVAGFKIVPIELTA